MIIEAPCGAQAIVAENQYHPQIVNNGCHTCRVSFNKNHLPYLTNHNEKRVCPWRPGNAPVAGGSDVIKIIKPRIK